jgi:DNA-binding beta-propeller fold protein YncE
MLWLRRAIGATVLMLLFSAALIAPIAGAAEAPPSHNFLFSLQGFIKEPGHIPVPPPEGEFEDACGVAVDVVGDIYLSDYYHHTIDVYGPTLEYLTQIADPDPDGPCALAVDSGGNVYVNHWHRNVVRFTPSEFPPTSSTSYGPAATIDFPSSPGARSTGVFLDPAGGDLYVDDRTYVAVYKAPIEPGEPPVRTFGLAALGQGYGVAVSDFSATDGNVYVPDAATDTVKVFDSSGALIDELDGAGTPQRGFHALADSALAIDQNDGHLFVADNLEPGFEAPKAVVDEFNPAGDFRGQLPHSFIDAEPTALAVDGAGNVYATSGNSEAAGLLAYGPTVAAGALAVTKTGTGGGTVTTEPAGINCGSACAAEYNAGAEVVLTAVPAAGSSFGGWSGGGCSGLAPCHLTIAVSATVSAEFAALPPAASTRSAGEEPRAAVASALPAPAAGFRLARITVGTADATLVAVLPSSGTLSATGPGLQAAKTRAPAAGTALIHLRLSAAGRRALAKAKGRCLALAVRITFIPDRSASSTIEATVRFKQRGGRRL